MSINENCTVRGWAQKTDESLQALAMEVEILVHLTYPGRNHPLVDNFKTKAFIKSISDPNIRLALYSAQKTNFVLAQETAQTISRPQVTKVRKMEVVEEDLLNKFKKMLKQVLKEDGQKTKFKYFNCGKDGHISKKLGSATKMVKIRLTNKRASYQPSTPESPLN